jgi:uncharacterized membrane protein
MNRRLLVVLLVLVALCAPPVLAEASTGGSMGGGSFGGGRSYSRSSSSRSYSRSYSSSYRSSGSHGGSSMSDGEAAALVSVLILGPIIVFGVFLLAGRGGAAGATVGRIDVSVLRLGLDWRARPFVQQELARIASVADTRTHHGLLQMLREVALLLRRTRDSWIYAGVVNSAPLAPGYAEQLFRAEVGRARAGFRHELIRAADGAVTTAAAPSDLGPRAEEGPGLVVITVAVAAGTPLIDFHDPANAEEVRRWLEAISQLHTGSLNAVEVIWTPAVDQDRMSSVELETFYPEMKRIRSETIVGSTECRYCRGRFPAELLSCPHCGGRVQVAA